MAASHAKGCVCTDCRKGVTFLIVTGRRRAMESVHDFTKPALRRPTREVPGVSLSIDALGCDVVLLP